MLTFLHNTRNPLLILWLGLWQAFKSGLTFFLIFFLVGGLFGGLIYTVGVWVSELFPEYVDRLILGEILTGIATIGLAGTGLATFFGGVKAIREQFPEENQATNEVASAEVVRNYRY